MTLVGEFTWCRTGHLLALAVSAITLARLMAPVGVYTALSIHLYVSELIKKLPVSWDAWSVNTAQKTTAEDQQWRNVLAGKPYMMGISPWFYTNLPQFNKNWLWKGDSLWYTRWEQAIDFQPEYVQVSTLDLMI